MVAAARLIGRISRQGIASAAARRWPEASALLRASVLAAEQGSAASCSSIKVLPLLNQPMRYSTSTFQRFGFSSSAPQQDDKEANKHTDDGDTEELDLSKEDLVKLVLEKEELLKSKDEEIKDMKDKVLRSYAEMENVIARTKRESENSKKYAVQGFSKSLLDVADNLSRASFVVKESFSKIDTSSDSSEAVPLLKTLLEGVEMTEKQLGEVFKKFGVEKFDPLNENFDPNRHYALFQIPDPSKPSGTVAAVVKVGYMLHDRVLRPAEVGVTEGGPTEEITEEKSSKSD
ncbi:grpE protein homolog 2, mitochondrial isoform X2 [Brachypodium distachyon]|uniref:GrpE protein homolog n=1 Tax=Brachypodium distachyon TaxID=15368 RepID=I1I3B7_BRADI|nr:grpE protein homolog 2, mitochondrial isoform X2 [Brachypodium distachyon]KQJ96321.1 hypothetical protein BRADI_3g22430v3 [Brachypodium distachyon]|eukprot:XP_010234640.1 grpE protein homolog 2, mitochondrial isoform X2 [Brachypodium distachyon]